MRCQRAYTGSMTTSPPATPNEHPATLAWLANGALELADPAAHNPFAPLPARLALVLVCLRRAGFFAELVKRKALMERNEDDNFFRNILNANSANSPELAALLARNAARRTREEDMVQVDVYAMQVDYEGSTWVMDEQGNLDEDQILVNAALADARPSGCFITPWALCNDRMVALDKAEKSSSAVDHVVAMWQSSGLQRDTAEVATSTPRRRI